LDRASPSIATARFAVTAGMRRLRDGLRRLATRLGAARLVAHRDEQRGDMFAMLPRLGKSGAGAIRLDSLRRQVDPNGVRIAVGAFDAPLGARFGNLHILDYAPSRVVESAQESPGTEQSSESAITER
jgi:hypothetical protein